MGFRFVSGEKRRKRDGHFIDVMMEGKKKKRREWRKRLGLVEGRGNTKRIMVQRRTGIKDGEHASRGIKQIKKQIEKAQKAIKLQTLRVPISLSKDHAPLPVHNQAKNRLFSSPQKKTKKPNFPHPSHLQVLPQTDLFPLIFSIIIQAIINYQQRQESQQMSHPSPCQPALCKKIQNYVFNFSDLLGQGNFSKVYRAVNEVTKEVVAIKIVQLNTLKSKKLEELLFSEIDILKKLNHPNVLKCHEVFTSNRNCYIITELCNEGDLESKLKMKKCLKEFEASGFIKDVHKGLAYLAESCIIHRDLKVSNIFIHNGIAKIADFGFAKMNKHSFKDINIGSPIYMSPEGLINNIYGPKTDVWAFGILIYELLHGQTPYSHCKSEKELKYNISIPIAWSQLKQDISKEIKEVIMKCMEVDENKRISVFEMKKLAYFSGNGRMSEAPMLSHHKTSYERLKKHQENNQSFSTLPLRNQHSTYESGKNIFKTEYQTLQWNTDRRDIEMSLNQHQKRQPTFMPLKHEKSLNTLLKKPQLQDKSKRIDHPSIISKNISTNSSSKLSLNTRESSQPKKDLILAGKINFKECVNILHYCRLLFKHLMLMKEIHFGDEGQTNIFKKWLSVILKTLNREVSEKKILIEGEAFTAKQKKLQEVTTQYIKKYSNQLNLDLRKVKFQESFINYQKIYNYFLSIFRIIDHLIEKDSVNRPLLLLGHSIIMICEHTKNMWACYDERSNKKLQKLKELEEYLLVNKANFDFPSYQWYKTKYWMGNVLSK